MEVVLFNVTVCVLLCFRVDWLTSSRRKQQISLVSLILCLMKPTVCLIWALVSHTQYCFLFAVSTNAVFPLLFTWHIDLSLDWVVRVNSKLFVSCCSRLLHQVLKILSQYWNMSSIMQYIVFCYWQRNKFFNTCCLYARVYGVIKEGGSVVTFPL